MYSKKCRTKNEALRNSTINWIFLKRLSIENYLKPSSITLKRRNKANYLTSNSIRLKFVKKTSTPNRVKNIVYIKCCSLSSPRSIKSCKLWHDGWVMAYAHVITHANQEKGGLGRQWKACPKLKLRGLLLPAQNSK